MEWLNGKKALIGSVVVAAIGLVWSLDQLIPGEWFTQLQYEGFGLFVSGLTGVAFRLAIGKVETK